MTRAEFAEKWVHHSYIPFLKERRAQIEFDLDSVIKDEIRKFAKWHTGISSSIINDYFEKHLNSKP